MVMSTMYLDYFEQILTNVNINVNCHNNDGVWAVARQ
jgi:hypothetical protein